jgi:hypothetical protein
MSTQQNLTENSIIVTEEALSTPIQEEKPRRSSRIALRNSLLSSAMWESTRIQERVQPHTISGGSQARSGVSAGTARRQASRARTEREIVQSAPVETTAVSASTSGQPTTGNTVPPRASRRNATACDSCHAQKIKVKDPQLSMLITIVCKNQQRSTECTLDMRWL